MKPPSLNGTAYHDAKVKDEPLSPSERAAVLLEELRNRLQATSSSSAPLHPPDDSPPTSPSKDAIQLPLFRDDSAHDTTTNTKSEPKVTKTRRGTKRKAADGAVDQTQESTSTVPSQAERARRSRRIKGKGTVL